MPFGNRRLPAVSLCVPTEPVATVAAWPPGTRSTPFRDIDITVPGTVAADGSVTFAEDLRRPAHDRRRRRDRAAGVAVRTAPDRGAEEDVPGDGDLAAILRYAA